MVFCMRWLWPWIIIHMLVLILFYKSKSRLNAVGAVAARIPSNISMKGLFCRAVRPQYAAPQEGLSACNHSVMQISIQMYMKIEVLHKYSNFMGSHDNLCSHGDAPAHLRLVGRKLQHQRRG